MLAAAFVAAALWKLPGVGVTIVVVVVAALVLVLVTGGAAFLMANDAVLEPAAEFNAGFPQALATCTNSR
jgi:hypothetical protein